MRDDLPSVLGFSVFTGIGPVRYRLLAEYFGSPRAAWNASVHDLLVTGLSRDLVRSFDRFRTTFDAPGYVRRLSRLGITVIARSDPSYPAGLREIRDAPILLYVLGKLPRSCVTGTNAVSVVGTRRMTPYGAQAVSLLIPDLVAAGCAIVSGMAYGIDTASHWAAIGAGGRTVAVLGCGIDIIAPAGNARLYRTIRDGHGAIVSEMPLSHRPSKGLFPARNRIISGLSRVTVVIEGTETSGSLITARYAADQGRDVCAVPGPITSVMSRGPNGLIRQGAVPVTGARDILEAAGMDTDTGDRRTDTGTGTEGIIVELLLRRPAHINDLVRQSGLTVQAVAAILTVLEMQGRVRDYGGKIYGVTDPGTK